MDPGRKPLQWLVWGALFATIIGIIAAYSVSLVQKGEGPDLPVISQLPDFSLTNQLSERITRDSLLGHVTVADIIFTRCAGPCPEMTRKMSLLQAKIPSDVSVRLLSLTTDPVYDTPAVLKQYASRFKGEPNRWWFITGPKPEIAQLAVGGLKLVAQDKAAAEQTTPEDLFIHSTMFVILDKQARLRGAFDSDEPDFQQKVLAAIKKLLREKA